MRNIDLESLHIFKTVVDYGGITRAASQLNRVQSNITTRVKNLEQRLGVKLFQRQGGKLVLSSEGKLLLSYAERLLRLSTEAEAALRSKVPQGTLRIGTMESTAAARLPPLLSRYHNDYPEVQIELVTGTSGALIAKVHRFEVEAAFVAEPFSAAGLEMQEAFQEELVLITSKNAPPVKTPKDLRKQTLIAFSTGCSYRRVLENWIAMSSIVPDRVLELASYHAIVACVAAGSGIAIVPRTVIAVMHAENDVAVYPLPDRVARAKTWLVWRDGHQSVALDAMRDALKKKR
ncbi:MAG TPA: LysR substrate-binding domain-containing protein [Noviherbaspirillum sp.]|uniref:LysR family transcriptional regulator n=1 Tax=Noviherbaspirillum sp. TaxID=1926288 RepID=UPI002D2610EA|nr:LysR substrate-binding domain-containing protein [Noviherbaspirillum sp.]HYD94815.1 LysR substrate-binding domain-containing protein [Noviherbaspirillum sp.]